MNTIKPERKPRGEPKTETLKVRLSESDIAKLDAVADRLNETKAEVIRLGIDAMYEKTEK